MNQENRYRVKQPMQMLSRLKWIRDNCFHTHQLNVFSLQLYHSHFQPAPPQYSQLPQQMQRRLQPPSVEVNEMGSTIQQGVIQHLVHQETQSWTTVNMNPVQPPMMSQTRATSTQGHRYGNAASDPEGNGRDILPEHDSTDYVMNCIHKS